MKLNFFSVKLNTKNFKEYSSKGKQIILTVFDGVAVNEYRSGWAKGCGYNKFGACLESQKIASYFPLKDKALNSFRDLEDIKHAAEREGYKVQKETKNFVSFTK